MYGVLENLPLADFVGQECNQIRLGEFQIQFHFANGSSIDVEGKWELLDRGNILIDQSTPHIVREAYCVHKLISQKICKFSIDVPMSFNLYFENKFVLKIYDDSEHYESFSVHFSSACSTHV